MARVNQSALQAAALHPLPLGHLRPDGWLRTQLDLQAAGMAGHLDEFWPDIGDSAWIGGTAEGWERVPYWLDAVVPLSRLLGEDRLARKVSRFLDHIIEHQADDGWMGPRAGADSRHGPFDVWPRMVLLKALLQYHEAVADDRIIAAAMKLCRKIHRVLQESPLHDWGRARWADLVYCLDALYERTGEPELLDTAALAHEQGLDWAAYAVEFPYREKITDELLQKYRAESDGVWMNDRYLGSHGVNVAMGLRSLPIWSRHGDSQREQFHRFLANLDEFHGQANGLFSADEHLAGTHPGQGTETCAVVEYLFSLAVAMQTWGPVEDVVDRWEQLAFNALPASARPNEWGHQYDQQVNQVVCHITEDRLYTNNGPDANIFGLEPHFGCCTANRHQGWPKFAARLWMRAADGGLTALSYAPCRLDTIVEGRRIGIAVSGEYPFSDDVEIRITAEAGSDFPIHLRIPAWAQDAALSVDDAQERPAAAGSTVSLRQDWSGEHVVRLRLPARLLTRRRPTGAITIRRGPILFALAVEEDWRLVGGQEPYADWEVHPGRPWNHSLEVDPGDPGQSLQLDTRPVRGPVFTVAGAPVRLRGRATSIPQWTLRHGAAGAPPSSPVAGEGPARDVTLLPYGAARLRVAEIPWHRPAG